MSQIIEFVDTQDYNEQIDQLYREWNRVEWVARIDDNHCELFCSM